MVLDERKQHSFLFVGGETVQLFHESSLFVPVGCLPAWAGSDESTEHGRLCAAVVP